MQIIDSRDFLYSDFRCFTLIFTFYKIARLLFFVVTLYSVLHMMNLFVLETTFEFHVNK